MSERKPRFNHVAMTVAPDLLDETGRAAILGFYGEVFGWEEMPTMTEDRKRLVLMAYRFGQFVFLEADDDPMRTHPMDHFGMEVDTREQLDETYARAAAYCRRDDRVVLEDRMLDDFGVLDLHAFYVRYLLPMKVEVQYFDWKQSA